MAPAAVLATALTALVALPLADPFDDAPRDLALLAFFGAGQFGVGFLLFMAGARLIPAAESSLIGMLEVVLGPLWVWLVLNERPGAASLVGGALILAALLANTIVDLVAPRRVVLPLGRPQGGSAMAFMVQDGFRLYYEDTGGHGAHRAVPARRRRQSPELVAAGAGVRRGVPVHHGGPARLRSVARRGGRARSRRARHRRARPARSPGDRAGRARRPVDGRLGGRGRRRAGARAILGDRHGEHRRQPHRSRDRRRAPAARRGESTAAGRAVARRPGRDVPQGRSRSGPSSTRRSPA